MRKLARIYLCLLGICAVLSLSLAQAQQGAPQPQTAPQQQTAAQQGPPAELPTAKDLSFLLGKWETKIAAKPNELTPEGVAGKGTAEFTLFGQAIQGLSLSESNRGHHELREFIVYQNGTNSYLIFTVNDRGVCSQRTLSRYVDSWVVEYTGHANDKDFTVRGRYKIISENELQYSSEVDVGKSGYKPFVEVNLKRSSKN